MTDDENLISATWYIIRDRSGITESPKRAKTMFAREAQIGYTETHKQLFNIVPWHLQNFIRNK